MYNVTFMKDVYDDLQAENWKCSYVGSDKQVKHNL